MKLIDFLENYKILFRNLWKTINMIKDFSVAILAGGKSKRFGSNKSEFKLNNKTLLQNALDIVHNHFDEIIISSNENLLFNNLNISVVNDNFANKGPLGGIQACLKKTTKPNCLFIAVDMPNLNFPFLQFLIQNHKNNHASMFTENSKPMTFPLIFEKKHLPFIEQILLESEKEPNNHKILKISNIQNQVSFNFINALDYKEYNKDIFHNINRIEDINQVG